METFDFLLCAWKPHESTGSSFSLAQRNHMEMRSITQIRIHICSTRINIFNPVMNSEDSQKPCSDLDFFVT